MLRRAMFLAKEITNSHHTVYFKHYFSPASNYNPTDCHEHVYAFMEGYVRGGRQPQLLKTAQLIHGFMALKWMV